MRYEHLTVLGIRSDASTKGAAGPSGNHLRWAFPAYLGFPRYGFQVYRRESGTDKWERELDCSLFSGFIKSQKILSGSSIRDTTLMFRSPTQLVSKGDGWVIVKNSGTELFAIEFEESPLLVRVQFRPKRGVLPSVNLKAYCQESLIAETTEIKNSMGWLSIQVLASSITKVTFNLQSIAEFQICLLTAERARETGNWSLVNPDWPLVSSVDVARTRLIDLPLQNRYTGFSPNPAKYSDDRLKGLVDWLQLLQNPNSTQFVNPGASPDQLKLRVQGQGDQPSQEIYPQSILLLAALDPNLAMVLSLYWVDGKGLRANTAYDYMVIGDWGTQRRYGFVFGVGPTPAQLPKVSSLLPERESIRQLDGIRWINREPMGRVGLRWKRPYSPGLIASPVQPVLFDLKRILGGNEEILTKENPLLVPESIWSSPEAWLYIDGSVPIPAPVNRYTYEVSGIDLFGQVGESVEVGIVDVKDLEAPPSPIRSQANLQQPGYPWLSPKDRLLSSQDAQLGLRFEYGEFQYQQAPDARIFNVYWRQEGLFERERVQLALASSKRLEGGQWRYGVRVAGIDSQRLSNFVGGALTNVAIVREKEDILPARARRRFQIEAFEAPNTLYLAPSTQLLTEEDLERAFFLVSDPHLKAFWDKPIDQVDFLEPVLGKVLSPIAEAQSFIARIVEVRSRTIPADVSTSVRTTLRQTAGETVKEILIKKVFLVPDLLAGGALQIEGQNFDVLYSTTGVVSSEEIEGGAWLGVAQEAPVTPGQVVRLVPPVAFRALVESLKPTEGQHQRLLLSGAQIPAMTDYLIGGAIELTKRIRVDENLPFNTGTVVNNRNIEQSESQVWQIKAVERLVDQELALSVKYRSQLQLNQVEYLVIDLPSEQGTPQVLSVTEAMALPNPNVLQGGTARWVRSGFTSSLQVDRYSIQAVRFSSADTLQLEVKIPEDAPRIYRRGATGTVTLSVVSWRATVTPPQVRALRMQGQLDQERQNSQLLAPGGEVAFDVTRNSQSETHIASVVGLVEKADTNQLFMLVRSPDPGGFNLDWVNEGTQFRYYAPYFVGLNIGINNPRSAASLQISIPPGDGTRKAYFAVSTTDRYEKEGPLSVPVQVTAVRPPNFGERGKPEMPFPCGMQGAEAGYATPPDRQGKATVCLQWALEETEGLRFEVARALDNTILAASRRKWLLGGEVPAPVAMSEFRFTDVQIVGVVITESNGTLRVRVEVPLNGAEAKRVEGGRLMQSLPLLDEFGQPRRDSRGQPREENFTFQVTKAVEWQEGGNPRGMELRLRPMVQGRQPEANRRDISLDALPDFDGLRGNVEALRQLAASTEEAFGLVTGVPVKEITFRDEIPGIGRNCFFYRVRAVDAAENRSEWSEVSVPFWQVDTTPPNPPEILRIVGGDRKVTLNWLKPDDVEIYDYQYLIYRSDNEEDLIDLRDQQPIAILHTRPQEGQTAVKQTPIIQSFGKIDLNIGISLPDPIYIEGTNTPRFVGIYKREEAGFETPNQQINYLIEQISETFLEISEYNVETKTLSPKNPNLKDGSEVIVSYLDESGSILQLWCRNTEFQFIDDKFEDLIKEKNYAYRLVIIRKGKFGNGREENINVLSFPSAIKSTKVLNLEPPEPPEWIIAEWRDASTEEETTENTSEYSIYIQWLSKYENAIFSILRQSNKSEKWQKVGSMASDDESSRVEQSYFQFSDKSVDPYKTYTYRIQVEDCFHRLNEQFNDLTINRIR